MSAQPILKGAGPKIKTRDGNKVHLKDLIKSREGGILPYVFSKLFGRACYTLPIVYLLAIIAIVLKIIVYERDEILLLRRISAWSSSSYVSISHEPNFYCDCIWRAVFLFSIHRI